MDMDLKKLRHLVAVARAGSFSAAAEQLHLSQPALSRSISIVEKQLGMRIFDRGVQGVALTSSGRMAVAEAEQLLKQVRIFDHNLKLYGAGEAGRVGFGMWSLIGSLVLPDLSKRFINERPGLQMWAAVKAANALLQNLRDDELEMFFCGEGQFEPGPDLRIDTIGSIGLSVLVRTGHPLARYQSISRSDLSTYPILCAVELSQVPEEFLDGGIFICDNFDVLRQTVQETDSIWLAPVQLVQRELTEGSLKSMKVTETPRPARIDIQMVTLKGYELSPGAQAVADYVKEFFADLGREEAGLN